MMGVSAPMSVIDVVMISSPGSGSIAATATCTAADPDASATANSAPIIAAKRFSRVAQAVPLVQVSVPVSITLASSASSSCPSVRPLLSWSDGRTIRRLNLSSGLCHGISPWNHDGRAAPPRRGDRRRDGRYVADDRTIVFRVFILDEPRRRTSMTAGHSMMRPPARSIRLRISAIPTKRSSRSTMSATARLR